MHSTDLKSAPARPHRHIRHDTHPARTACYQPRPGPRVLILSSSSSLSSSQVISPRPTPSHSLHALHPPPNSPPLDPGRILGRIGRIPCSIRQRRSSRLVLRHLPASSTHATLACTAARSSAAARGGIHAQRLYERLGKPRLRAKLIAESLQVPQRREVGLVREAEAVHVARQSG